MTNLNDVMLAYEANAAELNARHDGKWLLISNGQFTAFDELVHCAAHADRHYSNKPYIIRKIGSHEAPPPISVFYHAPEACERVEAHIKAA
jgi:hypothetical protein